MDEVKRAPAGFVFLQGRMAWNLGRPSGENPHDDPLMRRVWFWGYDFDARRNAARETPVAQAHPGRGRAVMGRRSDWTQQDIELLWYAQHLPRDELCGLLKRSAGAVKVKLSRLRNGGLAA